MTKYPLKPSYYAKTAIWGGNTLKNEWARTVILTSLPKVGSLPCAKTP